MLPATREEGEVDGRPERADDDGEERREPRRKDVCASVWGVKNEGGTRYKRGVREREGGCANGPVSIRGFNEAGESAGSKRGAGSRKGHSERPETWIVGCDASLLRDDMNDV